MPRTAPPQKVSFLTCQECSCLRPCSVGSSSPRWVLQELRSHEENWSGYWWRYNCLDRTSFPWLTWILSLAEDKICGLFGLRIQGPSVYKISLNLEVSPWDTVEICSNALKTRTLAVPWQGKLWYYHSPYSSLHDTGSPEPGAHGHTQGKEVNPGWPEMVSFKPLNCVYTIWYKVGKDCEWMEKGGKRKTSCPTLKQGSLQKHRALCLRMIVNVSQVLFILSCPAFIVAASHMLQSRKHWDIRHHPGIPWWDIFNKQK